jgi:hypothetical protein
MIKDEAKYQFDAVKNLIPEGILIHQKNDLSFEYRNIPDGFVVPTKEEIETEVIRLESEWASNSYARKRQAEYPTIAELVVALYDTDDKSAVEAKRAAVKLKYPKPS